MPQNKLKRDARQGWTDPLPGFPGYRTRAGRSGYDLLDTRQEAAHMEGTFYRNLFTLRLRTRNPFYLILMLVFGAATSAFMLFAWYALFTLVGGATDDLGDYLVLLPILLIFTLYLAVGVALLANFAINVSDMLRRREPRKKRR